MKNRDCYKIVILLANFNKKYSYLNLEKCLRYALLKKIRFYFNSKSTEVRMSSAAAAMCAVNTPGSATHLWASASKKLRASLLMVKVTVFVSPG